jgi:hypothetical protein
MRVGLVDTFVAYVGVYPSVEYAESDYQLVKDLHTKAGMLDAYDATVIEKRENGKCASPRSMRRRRGLAEYSAVVLGWRLGWLWHCSHSPQ